MPRPNVFQSVFMEAIQRATLDRLQSPGALDTIVVGSGATGGLAAQLLTDAGLRVLVLDAGIPRSRLGTVARSFVRSAVRRLLGSAAAARMGSRRQPIQSRCYAWSNKPEAFVDDLACPYTTPPDRPFDWYRARQLGGRMYIPGHGRQLYRLGCADLNPADGLSPPWPFLPGELDPWYSAVERQLKLAGMREGHPVVPDSDLEYELQLSENETDMVDAIATRWPAARPIMGRYAPPPRSLEIAAKSSRLMVRTGAVVREIEVDRSGRSRGVAWVDTQTGKEVRAQAPLIFLCASALESTRLLMLSRSPQHPQGLGGASGVLGRYLMDHIRVRALGRVRPLKAEPAKEAGRCIYLPRFDTRNGHAESSRGFGVQLVRENARDGRSNFGAIAYGEMLPRPENRVTLHEGRRDAWGIPILHVDCAHGPADQLCGRLEAEALRELAETVGAEITEIDVAPAVPGSANHECGTARMGRDPESSVLDPNNECWDARGLFLTDAASLPSQGTQNPTLTLLALTARACDHAVRTAVAR